MVTRESIQKLVDIQVPKLQASVVSTVDKLFEVILSLAHNWLKLSAENDKLKAENARLQTLLRWSTETVEAPEAGPDNPTDSLT